MVFRWAHRYCGTPLNTKPDLPTEEVVQLIRKGQATLQDDSVHFESADFFFDQKHAAEVADVLAATEDIRRVPKLAIARVDEVGDGELLQRLAKAGFKIIAYGVESFDDTVLRKIGKQTSEEQNKKALDLTIQAGIKPGMNLILFTSWDTVDTTLKTINYSLDYMERGAYINAVPYLFSGYGRAISRGSRFLEYEEYNFPGLKKSFRFPRLATNFDPDIARLKLKVQSKYDDLKRQADYPKWTQRSVTIDSLLYFKSFILLLIEEGLRDRDQMNTIVSRIDEAITRTIRAEASTMKEPKELTAKGVLETWFNTQNQLLTKAVLITEDEQRIILKLNETSTSLGKLIFDVYRGSTEGNELGESIGYVELGMDLNLNKITSSQIVFHHIQETNVFIHSVISDFVEGVRTNPDSLKDPLADSQKSLSRFTVHYHRLPSEPLFGQVISPAVYQDVSREDLINQIHATYQEGYAGLADAIYQSMDRAMLVTSYKSKYYIPFNEIGNTSTTPEKFLRPDLVISDMDLTQFPDDKDAERVIPELAQRALKYGVAAVSIYPRHLKYLPVQRLKSAGIKIGVVVAFPQGLGDVDLNQELTILEKAVEEGADEVDFVIDFESIMKGNVFEAEKSLAKFAMGVEEIKRRSQKSIRMKAILETQAPKTEGNIRTATRIALKYADMVKMVSGFPVEADGGQKGRANLSAAKIMLEEILYYYKRTGILRGMKITGGIAEWNNPDQPQQSALNYYNLVLETLGRHLGAHYLFERDLFRVGGYDGLSKFFNASHPEQMRPQSHLLNFQQAQYADLDIPSERETSLNMGDYLRTKFPAELLEAVNRKEARIEIYRGSATASENYIRSLVFQGYNVDELPSSDKFPPHHKFYRIQNGEEVTYLITGLIGLGRELFVVQALTRYFGYPEDKIAIRVFDEGGYKYFFNKSLGKYAGSIHKAVILHEIDNYVREITKGDNIKLKIIERIKNDYVDAVVVQTENNGLVLLFEMQFANASHAEQVAEYLISPTEQGGLGIKDLTLHGAAGGVGQNLQVNDLVVYNDVYWKQEKLESIPPNDVDIKRLDDLLPSGVEIRQAPIYDIPTVLNGSIAFMDEVEREGGGAVELEVAHAIRVVQKYRDVKFRAFYEIHDKPATTQQLDKIDAMGEEVAGYRDLEKRYDTWRALAKYLFSGKAEEPLAKPASKKEKDIELWRTLKPELSLSGYRRDSRIAYRLLVENKKDNIIFLGQNEGNRYYSNLQSQWNQENGKQSELIYWDAREYLLSLQQGANMSDLVASILKLSFSSEKVIFVDNVDVILGDRNLRERFFEATRANNVAVIGYTPSQAYSKIEESFYEQGSFDHDSFGRLNFEITTEENSTIRNKKIVVLGATGFVGSQILKQLKEQGFSNILGVSRTGSLADGIISMDLTNYDQLREIIKDADIVINAAVNLDFSGMQAGGETSEKAKAVNVGIPEFVASIGFKGQFIQLSSYYIFGDNINKATTQTPPQPSTVYGQQKLMAEEAVSKIPRHAIIRLGPMFGLDETGRQKEFYRSIVRQLEARRQGQPTQAISATTYPLSSMVYIKDVAQSIVGIIENEMPGISQISGEKPLDAVQQAQLITHVYNKKFGTNLSPELNIVPRNRGESLTPDVQMYSVTMPDIDKGINDFIDEVLQDKAMMGNGELVNNPGGIDLNPNKMDLKTQGELAPINIPTGSNMFNANIEGAYPVIINVTPIINLQFLLGIESKKEEQKYSYNISP